MRVKIPFSHHSIPVRYKNESVNEKPWSRETAQNAESRGRGFESNSV